MCVAVSPKERNFKTFADIEHPCFFISVTLFNFKHNMLTNLKVASVGFIMKVLYYKGFIIKKTSRNKYFSIARSLIYYYCKIHKLYTAPGFV